MRAELRDSYNNGKIVAMTKAEEVTDDRLDAGSLEAEAYERDALYNKNDLIAVDPEYLKNSYNLDYGTLMHEIAHKHWRDIGGAGGHSIEVLEAQREDLPDTAWDNADFAYEQEVIYGITDTIIGTDVYYMFASKDELLNSAIVLDWSKEETVEAFEKQVKYDSRDDWAVRAVIDDPYSYYDTNDHTKHAADPTGYLRDFLGASKSDEIVALQRSELYDTITEQYDIAKGELIAGIREDKEAQREARFSEQKSEAHFEGSQGRR